MTPQAFLERIGGWSRGRRYGLLAVLALLFFLPGFFSIPPVDRDESRFAQATKQMVETGDYVDIRFQDRARHKKPAGIYWLQAAAVKATGIDDRIWVYRLPSLLSAVAAVLLTAAIGGMLFGPGAGFAAGVVMACAILLNVEARTAKTDAALLAFTLAAMALLIRVVQGRARQAAGAYGFWAAAGVGFLVKGPLLFLPVAGLAIAESWRRRGLRWLLDLRPVTGFLLFALVAAPWFVAIGIATDWSFFAESVGKDMLGKVAGGQESHGAPPGLYAGLATLTFWPFSLLGLLAIPWIWRNRKRHEVWLLLGWALLTWIVFEATPTKLAHYVLPAYPALAVLAGAALAEGGLTGARWWRWTVFGLWAAVTLALALAMPVMGTEMGLAFDVSWLAGVLLLPVIFAGFRLAGGDANARHLAVAAVLVLIFSGAVFGRFLPSLEPAFVSPRVAALIQDRPGCGKPWLASAGFTEPSLVFLTETRTVLGNGAAAAEHLIAEPDCGIAAVEAREQAAFLDRMRASGHMVTPLRTVEGFNYARGRKVSITLYIAGGAE